MAQQDPQPVFGYKAIEILRGEGDSLGIGSYGAVYKARCDDLPCAAKILHPTLFQSNDPGARRLLQRFEQECSFMNRIRHPNIVLYLGVCRDTQTGLPVLLMEMLEENLTTFLERSQQRTLPFHVQVNLCYDVALALSYLHSNDIIHRDLSSNNVLMVAGHRIAKVADFGMSKLISSGISKRLSMSLTHCPGTEVYMPPETFRGNSQYTDKLDCFSFGVLVIQIITCLFPDPGERTRVETFPNSPTGLIEVPVPETERRQSHIKLIDSDHPLLSIAISCVNYKPEERPSAQEICGQIIAIRDNPKYTESRQHLKRNVGYPRDQLEVASKAKSRIPRTISATNLAALERCKNYFQHYPNNRCTFTLPTLDNYAPEFKQQVLDHLSDKETQHVLEREHVLNWCKSIAELVPLKTKDDGNNLCNAASLGIWGVHDADLYLRNKISHLMSQSLQKEPDSHANCDRSAWNIKRRFEATYKYHANNHGETGAQLNSGDEWKRLAEVASLKAASGKLQNLEEFHIFVLAHYLDRPIIVYANCDDTELSRIKYHGIYLPLHNQNSGYPLPLVYQDGHFCALLCADLTQLQQFGYLYLPIHDYYGRMFPIKYLNTNETSSGLLQRYLQKIQVQVPDINTISPYFNTTTTSVTCAKLQVQHAGQQFSDLQTEFIDACHKEYIHEKQERNKTGET